MIHKLMDLIGGSSLISGITLAVINEIDPITDPLISLLTVVSLAIGIMYAFARWRGKCLENRIRRKKLEEMEGE
ncbi:MAG: hypothetical protein ACOC4Y_00800 [bacterium]